LPPIVIQYKEEDEDMKRIRLFEIISLVLLLSLTGVACVSNTAGANGEKLESVTWELKAYGEPNDLTAAVMGHEPTLTFDKEEGTLGGNTGVNAYGGKYELNGNKLTVEDLYQTLIASTNPALNEQEAVYMKILGSAESFKVDDEELTITGTEGVLVFENK
jgi:heat shock protein HslJ